MGILFACALAACGGAEEPPASRLEPSPEISPSPPIASPPRPEPLPTEAPAPPTSPVAERWLGRGPEGGCVNSLVVWPGDPDLLLAGTVGGLHRSTDGGASWERVGGLLNEDGFAPEIAVVAIHPTDPNRVMAGVDEIGVFATEDGGDTWALQTAGLFFPEAVSSGRQAPFFDDLAFDSEGGRLAFARLSAGVFRRAPDGATWELLEEPNAIREAREALSRGTRNPLGAEVETIDLAEGTREVSAVATHERRPEIIIAGTERGGVYRSEDRGESWQPSNAGLVASTAFEVAADPSQPGTVYAGTTDGLFRSADHGLTWTRVPGPFFGTTIDEVAVSPIDPETLFVMRRSHHFRDPFNALLRTRDSGESWEILLPSASRGQILIDPDRPERIWVASSTLRQSLDGGDSWLQIPIINGHIRCTEIFGVALLSGPNQDRLFVTNRSSWIEVADFSPRLFSSRLDPTHGPCSNELVSVALLCSIAIVPSDPPEVYRTCPSPDFRTPGTLVHTRDPGDTWDTDRPWEPVETFYAGAGKPGTTWAVLTPKDEPPLVIVGTAEKGVFVASAKGQDFDARNTGLPKGAIRSLDEGPDGVVFAGTEGGGVAARILSPVGQP